MNQVQSFEQALLTTREQLWHEISSLKEEELNRVVNESTWSIGQIVNHLWKTETLFSKAILYGLKRNALSNTERKPIEVVLDPSVKYQAPAVAEPDVGPFELAPIIQLLGDSRVQLLKVLGKVDDIAILKGLAFHHPRFGDLPLDQWVELLYMHEQRHIEQIKGIKALY
ncbi:DinB family protein [Paenibacillus paeoniae]|uniref:DinB family protein n=1 Tax=Paenibacillus paeoniae TaxID=2292705 RepID=A0A371PIJ4_9BACL|nr:DinB family protein [Paenibacillus paeoniae]REK76028.1 DinB family protein [Paenibacillus paeoniae]